MGEASELTRVVVRQAVLSDLESLVPLFDAYRQFYGAAGDLDVARNFLLDRFNHGEAALFIASAGPVAAGFIQLYPVFSSVSLRRTFVLNDLFVHESFRRQGIARKLLASSVEFAGRLGAARLSLCTATTNTAAQALYSAAGWKRDAQFIYYHFADPAPGLGHT